MNLGCGQTLFSTLSTYEPCVFQMPNTIIGNTKQGNIIGHHQIPTTLLVPITNPHIKIELLQENEPKTSINYPDLSILCFFLFILGSMGVLIYNFKQG